MLHKLFRRLKVSEIQLCLPFVQITCAVLDESGEMVTHPRRIAPSPPADTPRQQNAVPGPVSLAVAPVAASAEVNIAPTRSQLITELSFRIATEVDAYGPVFRTGWQPLSAGLQLHPGDYLWLRLYCYNPSDRVVHNVRIAMEGIDIAHKQCGILIRGINGWPRQDVGNVTEGSEIKHINPGEDYSLHCILRVPPRIDAKKRTTFQGIKPEFSILKQLQ